MNLSFHPFINYEKKTFWNIIEKSAGTNYYLDRALYKYKLHHFRKKFNGPTLLVYQMGKVGSKTVVATLNKSKLAMPVYHVHHLTKNYFSKKENELKKQFSKEELIQKMRIQWEWQYLRSQLDKGIDGSKWKIVTLVRDPIAVNVSSFFHHFKEVNYLKSERSYKIRSQYYDFDVTVKLEDIDALLDLFLNRVDHASPLMFFDDELKSVFGIDVFSYEFPKSKGYKIYEEELADVLLIKLENLNDCMYDAFKEFLNIEIVAINNTNIGTEKKYAPLYNAFKKYAVLPHSYIDKMYTSKYCMHFYSEEEIINFKKKWGFKKD